MKMLTLAVCTAASLTSTAVYSSPIPLPNGPLFVDISTAEQYSKSNNINSSLNPGAGGANHGNWGIVQINSIQLGRALAPAGSQIDPLGPTIFSDGQNGGEQILGVFFEVLNNAGVPETSTGGFFDLYFFKNSSENVSSEFSAANLSKRGGVDGSQYTGFTCQSNTPNCTFLVRFRFTPGADINSQTNSIFSPLGSSDFESYLSVDTTKPGDWTNLLDSNYFTLNPVNQSCGTTGVSCTSANDLRTDGQFTQNGAGAWDIAGTDIIGLAKDGAFRAFIVPEPDSFMLVSLSLLGLGVVGFRCRQT